MLIEAFFQDEKAEIEELEIKIANLENALSEAVEDVDYEPDSEKEDEEPVKKPATAKAYLKAAIKELESEEKEEYIQERDGYKKQLQTIETIEADKKQTKNSKDECEEVLKYKLEVKRYGELETLQTLKTTIADIEVSIDNLQEVENILIQIEDIIQEIKTKTDEQKILPRNDKEAKADKKTEIDELKKRKKELLLDKKKYKADLDTLKKLRKDEVAINESIEKLDGLFKNVAVLTSEEAKELTLEKHHALIENELNSGIKGELSILSKIFENLKNKYQKSLVTIENELKQSEEKIDSYLSTLGYLDE